VEAEYHANDVAKPPTRSIFLKTGLNFAVPEIGNKKDRGSALSHRPCRLEPPDRSKEDVMQIILDNRPERIA
jgi:hypothetical protein